MLSSGSGSTVDRACNIQPSHITTENDGRLGPRCDCPPQIPGTRVRFLGFTGGWATGKGGNWCSRYSVLGTPNTSSFSLGPRWVILGKVTIDKDCFAACLQVGVQFEQKGFLANLCGASGVRVLSISFIVGTGSKMICRKTPLVDWLAWVGLGWVGLGWLATGLDLLTSSFWQHTYNKLNFWGRG